MTINAKATTMPVVEEGRRRRRMSAGVECLVLLGLTLAALGHVAVQAKRIEFALELGRAQGQHLELVERRRRLVSEIARLKDPGRIETIARDRLGMALPAATDIRAVPRSAIR